MSTLVTGGTSADVPMRAPTKTDYAYQQIRARILHGQLDPGSLIAADAIGAELGLSATPVREAMGRLAAEGFVVVSAHRETRVSLLSRAEAEQLYAVRLELDPLAARDACRLASDGDLSLPRQLLGPPPTAADPLRGMLENREFHRAIYGRCGNDVLVNLLETLWDRTDRYRLMLNQSPTLAQLAYEEHLAITLAFEARDASTVRKLTKEHLKHSLANLMRQIDRSEQAEANSQATVGA